MIYAPSYARIQLYRQRTILTPTYLYFHSWTSRSIVLYRQTDSLPVYSHHSTLPRTYLLRDETAYPPAAIVPNKRAPIGRKPGSAKHVIVLAPTSAITDSNIAQRYRRRNEELAAECTDSGRSTATQTDRQTQQPSRRR